MNIPLEDDFHDILCKAQRGLGLAIDQLAISAGIAAADLQRVMSGKFDEHIVRRVAPLLHLSADRLVVSGRKAWRPLKRSQPSLLCCATPYGAMTVNAYLVCDTKTKRAAAFDTGTDCSGMLDAGFTITDIFITHTHADHIADLERLKQKTDATVHVSRFEPLAGAHLFEWGERFSIGGLTIECRQTSGHSRGGTTYVVTGLATPVAVVGDAMFAGSMGNGFVSYTEALRNNREQILTLTEETILCPGHGPLTTVGEEKAHNPFFP